AGWTPPSTDYPIGWILTMLLVCAGVPFFAVATSAPLLQAWFAQSRHTTAHDPYYLYAASNAGSLTGLLSYPFFFEVNFRLVQQSWIWMVGYGLLILLVGACAVVVLRAKPETDKEERDVRVQVFSSGEEPNAGASARPNLGTRLRWIALAFVPSSLLLGLTTY